jgi:hypothetical protein
MEYRAAYIQAPGCPIGRQDCPKGQNLPEHKLRGRERAQAFNPFCEVDNCFYVALGRLCSLPSTTVASLTGHDERETKKIGLTPKGIIHQDFAFICC